MKKIVVSIMAAALLFTSCSEPKPEDPALTAIKARVAELVGGDAEVKIKIFEKVDSTTFGQEIEYRLKVQDLALQQNAKYVQKYRNAGKDKNAQNKLDLMEKNRKIIKGLESIQARMADSLNVVAYYDYKFSGEAVSNGQTTVFRDYFASISPDNQVLSIEPQSKGLHKALGRVIPGYKALLGE